MAEIKIKTVEKGNEDNDAIDFSTLDNEVVKEKEQIKINNEKEAKEKKEFHFDKKVWTIFGITAVAIVIVACLVAFVLPNFLA